jgi:feruloyl-CoA synthase
MASDADIFAPVDLRIEQKPNGVVLLSNGIAPIDSHDTLIDRLRGWAERTPDHIYLAERDGADWRRLTFQAVWTQTESLARRLLGLSLDAERPLMIIAPNSIDHALVGLAAMRIGAPTAAVSVAHAASPGQLDRLRHVIQVLTPGAVYVDGPPSLYAGVRSLELDIPVLTSRAAAAEGLTRIDDLSPASDAALGQASGRVGPETIAKFLFTSGSTGTPKAVPNTHRMMCSNMDALGQVWPFLTRRPPVMVDWLPWNHTFGSNFCFNMALVFGGSFYIDAGQSA